jgi:hypothetical protein
MDKKAVAAGDKELILDGEQVKIVGCPIHIGPNGITIGFPNSSEPHFSKILTNTIVLNLSGTQSAAGKPSKEAPGSLINMGGFPRFGGFFKKKTEPVVSGAQKSAADESSGKGPTPFNVDFVVEDENGREEIVKYEKIYSEKRRTGESPKEVMITKLGSEPKRSNMDSNIGDGDSSEYTIKTSSGDPEDEFEYKYHEGPPMEDVGTQTDPTYVNVFLSRDKDGITIRNSWEDRPEGFLLIPEGKTKVANGVTIKKDGNKITIIVPACGPDVEKIYKDVYFTCVIFTECMAILGMIF